MNLSAKITVPITMGKPIINRYFIDFLIENTILSVEEIKNRDIAGNKELFNTF